MQQPKITSGPNEVLASGIVISFERNPIVLEIENLKFNFEFVDEEGKEEPIVKFDAPSEYELKITFSNFKNPLGTGNIKPLAIGKIHKRQLLRSFGLFFAFTVPTK